MKVVYSAIITLFLLLTLIPGVLHAQGEEYVPLSPLPALETVSTDDPSNYIDWLFTVLVALAAVLAVLMIAIGGLQYMGTDAWSTKEEARKRIYYAVGGLLLLLFSVLLLTVLGGEQFTNLQFFDSLRDTLAPTPTDPGPPDRTFAL